MQIKRKLAALVAGIALVAGAAVVAPAVGATPAPHAQAAGGCRLVTYPPTLPWWQCISLTPGYAPAGCFSRQIYTCY